MKKAALEVRIGLRFYARAEYPARSFWDLDEAYEPLRRYL